MTAAACLPALKAALTTVMHAAPESPTGKFYTALRKAVCESFNESGSVPSVRSCVGPGPARHEAVSDLQCCRIDDLRPSLLVVGANRGIQSLSSQISKLSTEEC